MSAPRSRWGWSTRWCHTRRLQQEPAEPTSAHAVKDPKAQHSHHHRCFFAQLSPKAFHYGAQQKEPGPGHHWGQSGWHEDISTRHVLGGSHEGRAAADCGHSRGQQHQRHHSASHGCCARLSVGLVRLGQ